MPKSFFPYPATTVPSFLTTLPVTTKIIFDPTKLLFNLVAVQPIHSAKFHGGGSYGEVLFWALVKRFHTTIQIFCAYDSQKYLDSKIQEACKELAIPLCDIRENSPQSIIDANAIDTFYTPLFSLEKKWAVQVKRFVFTWHGVRALEMNYSPQGISFAKTFSQKAEALVRYRKNWKELFYKPKYDDLANRIAAGNVQTMTVSEHSKASIQTFFPQLMRTDIPVFYSPMQEVNPQGELPDGVLPQNYFLLTSGARWEKNNLRAVRAFDSLVDSIPETPYRVVVTGVTNEKVYRRRLKHPEKFIFLGYVETETLELLHQNAYAFIFPSLNEGFGYPPMQSMRYGVPVAASGTSSIPEVCGDAAIYFDPYSESEIRNRFAQLLNPAIYNRYAERARIRYAQVHERQVADLEKAVDFIVGN